MWHRLTRQLQRFFSGGLLLVLLLPGRLPAEGLTAAAQDGYLIWLHSLEATIASRLESGRDEERLLYPTTGLPAPGDATENLLDVARALADLEGRPRLLQEPPGRTVLHALNRARNHAYLAEYDSALVWYAEAARRDGDQEYAADLGQETMIAAIATDAADVVRGRLPELLRRSSHAAEPDLDLQLELELACRFLLARADTSSLQRWVDGLASAPQLRRGRLAYWQAFSLSWLGRWAESLVVLTEMLTGDGRSHGLDETQRAWVLMAIPDQLLLSGDRATAAGLYGALAASTIPDASLWAGCQAAALDLLAGRFLKAGTTLEDLCRRPDNTIWRLYACNLANLSDELERLRSEAQPHGAAVYYQR